jgi:hypothetical protein
MIRRLLCLRSLDAATATGTMGTDVTKNDKPHDVSGEG